MLGMHRYWQQWLKGRVQVPQMLHLVTLWQQEELIELADPMGSLSWQEEMVLFL